MLLSGYELQSGWNPYAGEEEPDKKPSWLPQEILNTGTKQEVKCSSAISGAGSGSADAAGAGI